MNPEMINADAEDSEGETGLNGTVDAACMLAFVLAGNSVFTVENTRTGGRFTFKVKLAKNSNGNGRTWFVGLLSGPDNTSDYSYMGCIFESGLAPAGRCYTFKRTAKSRISDQAPSHVAFKWSFERIVSGSLPECVKVWHMGRCGRCGRALTVPESIATGLGPVCASKA